MAWTKLVDLELTAEEKLAREMPCAPIDTPKYPWGLCIRFDQGTLDKLGLDAKDVAVGDMIDLRAFGVVTSVSINDTAEGPNACVEVQLQKIAVEDEETEETPGDDESDARPRRRSLYGT